MNILALCVLLSGPPNNIAQPPIAAPKSTVDGLIDINMNLSLVNVKLDSMTEQWKRSNDIIERNLKELVSIKDYTVIGAAALGTLVAGIFIGKRKAT